MDQPGCRNLSFPSQLGPPAPAGARLSLSCHRECCASDRSATADSDGVVSDGHRQATLCLPGFPKSLFPRPADYFLMEAPTHHAAATAVSAATSTSAASIALLHLSVAILLLLLILIEFL